MADKNIISSSKKEIYTKLLDIAEKYTDIKNTDFLKTGLFGYITESMAMMIRDSSYHKTMLYNESFLNTAVIPKSVYNWAKMFNVEVQKATPKYAEIEIRLPINNLQNLMKSKDSVSKDKELKLNKEDPIIAGGYYFSLEHSIIITYSNEKYSARYDSDEYTSTNFQNLNGNYILTTKIENSNTDVNDSTLVIYARAYQYKRTVVVKQITSNSFLNKVQHYDFDDQFCGAKLFYKDGNENKPVNLTYSDLSNSPSEMSAFYNLSNDNELELIFKTGSGYFMPSSNSQLILYIYTTKALDAPKQITDDGIMLFSDADLKSLPVVISFNPTSLIGGKNMPSLSDIKETIINEISTRNTITTKSDLNNYFNILTSLIEDVNDGKVTFTKKRDDILRRIYNAYLLLRDNSDDSKNYVAAANGYLSSCVPTNTIPYAVLTSNGLTNDNNVYSLSYPKFSSDGTYLSSTSGDYFICPFHIFIDDNEVPYVKYIYNMTDSTSVLKYSKESSSLNSSEKYIIPEKVRLFRGFKEDSIIEASDRYILTFFFKTNMELKKEDISGSIDMSGKNTTISLPFTDIISIESSLNDDSSYSVELSIAIDVVIENQFEYNNNYANTINLGKSTDKNNGPFNESEILKFNFSNIEINNIKLEGLELETTEPLVFFQSLDDIMESSIVRKTTTEQKTNSAGQLLYKDSNGRETTEASTGEVQNTPVYKITFGLSELPVVHSSFFNNSFTNRREGFITQLFTYIKILKENLNKLETSTFFNLKFYNTYGDSKFYDTPYTNVSLGMCITLKDKYKDNSNLMNEIRSYIRKVFDKMNDSQAFSFSTINALLRDTKSYGNYIEDIEFNDLNGGLTQSIGRIPDVAEEDYPPEWLNLDALTLFPINDAADSDSQKGLITFK